jgi:hypothetical protein
VCSSDLLGVGEIGFETDTNSFKVGDGVNSWGILEYFTNESGLAASLEDYINVDQLGVPNGVPTLDANGFVPASQLDIDVTADINAAFAALVDTAPGTLDTLNELAAAIGDDANFITTINTSITDGDAATLASANTYADTAESDAIASANSYTGGRETAITTAYQAYADQAEADAISAAASDATTKANTAETNAENYTDNLIGDGTVDGTTGNTVTDRIASAVSGLVDSAPGTLDTLNELAAALGDDANFATTVTNSLASKASSLEPTITDPTINATSLTPGVTDTIYYASTRYDADFPGGPADQDESIFYSTPNDPPLFSVGDIVTVTNMDDARANVVNATVTAIDGQFFVVFVGAENVLPQYTNSYNVGGLVATVTGVDIPTPVVVSTNELSTLDGITSNIQTQLDAKSNSLSLVKDIYNSYTLDATDAGAILLYSYAGTITVPADTFAIGTKIDVILTYGAGPTFAAGAGCSILSANGSLSIDTQYAAASLVCTANNQFILVGKLA